MTALNAQNLLHVGGLPVPTYDRSAATVGIVHIGFGNFHRSHQAMYLDRLMESGSGLDWGICGVGLLPQDAAIRDVMSAQDCLYTLVLRPAEGPIEPRVIGSVLDFRFGPDDPEAVLERMADPMVRIVSLTVTEGGYLKDAATGQFDADDPAVRHDLQEPGNPSTAFAYIVEALRRRRACGVPAFTVLSCDNLQGNGGDARQAVTGFARLVDPDLADWIDSSVAFPNCMVDRITPVTTDSDRAMLREEFGVEDGWPVPGEPFTQWVVEDDFPAGRPALETVGVQFVPDVGPYELMKLRLLNASHQAIAYLGGLLGHVYVDEAMRDQGLRDYLMAHMIREAAPTLEDLPGIDLDAYMRTLIERFSNPRIRDTLNRLATDGANRMATFTLPVIRANLDAGRPVGLGAAMVAAWAHYWERISLGDTPPAGRPDDVHAPEMVAAAGRQAAEPMAFIGMRSLFGDLGSRRAFTDAFLSARASLLADGVHATLHRLLSPR